MRRSMGAGRRGPGLVGTMARTAVIAGTATAVVGGMSDAKANKAAQQAAVADMAAQQQQLQAQQAALAQQQQWLAAQQQAQPSEATAPAAAGTGGVTAESMALLKQLSEMQQQGILTPEEFAQQKAKILGS